MDKNVTLRHKTIVTLVSISQAEVGKVFIHKGSSSKCKSCRYSQVCVRNLEPERVYKIVEVRKKALPCSLYKTDMQVVEVMGAEISAVVPSKQAIEGAIVTFHMPDCEEQRCENYEFCSPKGLKDGDRCEIIGVTENLQCPRELPLKKVLLRLVQAS